MHCINNRVYERGMKLYKDLVILENNPFKDDKFNRKEFIDNLMSVLSTYDSGMVVSIDSAFGTGKTTFVKMWEEYLKNEKFNQNFMPIYFNVWDNDDTQDPLIPLISLLSNHLFNEKEKEFKETGLYEVGRKLLKAGLPIALKAETGEMIDLSNMKFNDNAESCMEDYAEKVGKTIFDNYKEKNDLKIEFKNTLMEYQKLINKKVIIFIDELDRCRPLYAIEVLDMIKHFFELDNFIFVLCMDKNQLSHSIGTVYGNNMDSVGYLRRFIDLEFTLPQPDINTYFNYMISQYELQFKNQEYFWYIIKELSIINNISLRDIDKLFINLKVLLPQIDILKENTNFKLAYTLTVSNIYAYLLVLKIKRPLDYKKILEKNYTQREIVNLVINLGIDDLTVYFTNYDDKFITKVLHDSIRKFLELNLQDFSNKETYGKITNENSNRYRIGTGDDFNDSNSFKLTDLWKEENGKCDIITNLTFTNNIKTQ